MASENPNKIDNNSMYHLLKILIIVIVIGLLIGLFFSGKLSTALQKPKTEQGK